MLYERRGKQNKIQEPSKVNESLSNTVRDPISDLNAVISSDREGLNKPKDPKQNHYRDSAV